MTADADILAALEFEPTLCWMRTCDQDAITLAKPECGCWQWRLCPKHDAWLRALLEGRTHCYCGTCHRSSPVTLEDL